MNAKTLEAVRKHGESLLAAFPNCTEKDPVALCKKLRRIETSLTKPLTDYCNGDFDAGPDGEKLDAITDKALKRVNDLIGEPMRWFSNCPVEIVFVNRDPRGYALKIDNTWVHEYRKDGASFYTDMGGYGILAPDLNR